MVDQVCGPHTGLKECNDNAPESISFIDKVNKRPDPSHKEYESYWSVIYYCFSMLRHVTLHYFLYCTKNEAVLPAVLPQRALII
jgi:hypothetical protein